MPGELERCAPVLHQDHRQTSYPTPTGHVGWGLPENPAEATLRITHGAV